MAVEMNQKNLPYSKAKTKKSVRFAKLDKVSFRPVMADDLQRSWYQTDEYHNFEHDRQRTVRAFVKVGGDVASLDPNHYCLRGLEGQLSTKMLRLKRHWVSATVRLVLSRQAIHRQQGKSDPASLGAVSMVISQPACQVARAIAAVDSKIRYRNF